MSKQLEKIMDAEKKIQKEINKANERRELLISIAVEEGTNESNKLHEETEIKIKQMFNDKKQRISEIDEQLETVMKRESEKMTKKVSKKIDNIIEQIYEEALGSD